MNASSSEYLTFLHSQGYTDIHVIEKENIYVAIMPLMFNYAIITGKLGNEVSFDYRWMYSNYRNAKKHLEIWASSDFEGEPIGWTTAS